MESPPLLPDPPTSRPATPIPPPADSPASTADTRFPFPPPSPPDAKTAVKATGQSSPQPWFAKVLLDQTGIEIPTLWVSQESPRPAPMPGPATPAVTAAAAPPSPALMTNPRLSTMLKVPPQETVLEEPDLESPLYPQRKNSLERRSSRRAGAVAAAAAAARDRNCGPPQPNMTKLLSGRGEQRSTLPFLRPEGVSRLPPPHVTGRPPRALVCSTPAHCRCFPGRRGRPMRPSALRPSIPRDCGD